MDELNLNCDFYEHLPHIVIVQLECLQKEFKTKHWFNEAWTRYRKYILREVAEGSKTLWWPAYIFNEYLEKEFEVNQKLKKRPVEIRAGLWKCVNCGGLIADSAKVIKESNGQGPSSCPKCGMKFVPTRRQ